MISTVVVTGITVYLLIQPGNANRSENDNTNMTVVNQVNTNVNTNSVVNTNQATNTNSGINTNTIVNTNTINNINTAPEENDNKVISYQTGKYTVFYELNSNPFAQKQVTIYLDDGNSKTELFKETAWSIGGTNPEFQELKDANIVLLTFGNGDSGGFWKNYHYINVINKNVVSIQNINDDASLIKISAQQQSWEISTFIQDACKSFENGKVVIRDVESSLLTDLTLNGERVNILTQETVLKCVDPGGLGSWFDPYVELKYLGINKNLSKIFFSLTTTDTIEFAFDINNQTISRVTLNDLVE